MRTVGFIIGVLLLAAAVWALRGRTEALHAAFSALARADAVTWALVLSLPLLNCAISAECLLLLTRRFAPAGVVVRRREMLGLVSAAWLLNYLPMKPGLVGRVAYHSKVHQVRVADSARAVAEVIACGAVALTLLGGAVLLRPALGPAPLLWILIAAPFVYASTWFAPPGVGSPTARAFLATIALKVLDSAVWALRLSLAFGLAGRPISLPEAAASAVAVQAASLLPLGGNGLGVGEWALGLLSAASPEWLAGGASGGLAEGLSAGLLNRAVELAVAIPAGLMGAWSIAGRSRGRRPA